MNQTRFRGAESGERLVVQRWRTVSRLQAVRHGPHGRLLGGIEAVQRVHSRHGRAAYAALPWHEPDPVGCVRLPTKAQAGLAREAMTDQGENDGWGQPGEEHAGSRPEVLIDVAEHAGRRLHRIQ